MDLQTTRKPVHRILAYVRYGVYKTLEEVTGTYNSYGDWANIRVVRDPNSMKYYDVQVAASRSPEEEAPGALLELMARYFDVKKEDITGATKKDEDKSP